MQSWKASIPLPTVNSCHVPLEGSSQRPSVQLCGLPALFICFQESPVALTTQPPAPPQETVGWTFCVWYLEKRRRRLDCRAKLRRPGTCALNSGGLGILNLMDISSSKAVRSAPATPKRHGCAAGPRPTSKTNPNVPAVWAHRCILAIIPLSTLTPQRLRGP